MEEDTAAIRTGSRWGWHIKRWKAQYLWPEAPRGCVSQRKPSSQEKVPDGVSRGLDLQPPGVKTQCLFPQPVKTNHPHASTVGPTFASDLLSLHFSTMLFFRNRSELLQNKYCYSFDWEKPDLPFACGSSLKTAQNLVLSFILLQIKRFVINLGKVTLCSTACIWMHVRHTYK